MIVMKSQKKISGSSILSQPSERLAPTDHLGLCLRQHPLNFGLNLREVVVAALAGGAVDAADVLLKRGSESSKSVIAPPNNS